MQYTGLKDKNGKEIYEGDIVREQGFVKTVVKWDNRKQTQYGHGDSTTCIYAGFSMGGWGSSYDTREEVKVIGNIYENPELI